jgi:acyl-CoA thioesterase
VTEFEAATAVTPTGGGTYAADISKDWWVFTGPNGGYVASVILRAMTERAGDAGRPARSLTVHYLRPAREGAAEIRTDLARAGRSLSTVTAELYQGGERIALATAAFAAAREGGWAFHDAVAPAAPAPDALDTRGLPTPVMPPIAHRFEYRPVTNDRVFGGAARADTVSWLRLREPAPYDPVLLATVSDAHAPAVFVKAVAPLATATVDLTVHFRTAAVAGHATGWCLGAFRSTVAADGYVEEDGEMYAEDGTLLAQSRQLAVLVPLGP